MTCAPGGRRWLALTALAIFGWLLLVGGSYWSSANLVHEAMIQLGLGEARTHLDKDAIYRHWVNRHGGVYVPVTEQTPPNPDLAQVPERDIRTPSGRLLTLINPAYMTRQVQELGAQRYGVHGHITSLKPIRPENAADPWEIGALTAFEDGAKEVFAIEPMDGAPHLRLMRPFMTDPGCLKCHAAQGYQRGDVRGGISVSVPLAPYVALENEQLQSQRSGHLILASVGLLVLGFGSRALRRRIVERENARVRLELDKERFASLLDLSALAQGSERELIERALEEVERLTGSDIAFFHFYTESESTIELHSWSRRTREQCQLPDLDPHYPLAKAGIWADALRQRRPVIHNDYARTAEKRGYPAGHFPLLRELCVPIFEGEQIVAVAGVGNKPTPYDDGDQLQMNLYMQRAWDILRQKRTELELDRYRLQLEERVAERTQGLQERTEDLERSRRAMTFLLADISETKEQLEKANSQLQELDRLKSMFIASMSHELRTPLNAIIGFSGILHSGMAGELNSEQSDMLERVRRSGRHLLNLITDIIDIAKIESGKIAPFISEFSLNEALDEAVDSLRQQAQEKGLRLVAHGLDPDINLCSDRKRLLQCLLNLLSNAVKFTPAGEVRIDLQTDRAENGRLLIRVSDTGIGMTEAQLKELFTPFVRLDSPLKTSVPGTGLGLYLTRKLATEILGGSINAQSSAGSGSTFTLSCPLRLNARK